MSLTTFIHSLEPPKKQESVVEPSRMDKLDYFLDNQVIDKFKQPWKNLTKFLKRNRIIFFFKMNDDLKEEHIAMVLGNLDNNLITPKDIKYNEINGEIDNIFKLKT